MKFCFGIPYALPIFALAACVFSAADLHAEDIRFDRDIRPILSDKCFFCHGPDEENREADLRLDIEKAAKATAIVEADPQSSDFVQRIISKDPDLVMPPPGSHKELNQNEIQLLTDWVKQGASWTQHWAFVPPSKIGAKVTATEWASNPIDQFVVSKLQHSGIAPKPSANRDKLLRRLSFDLTGLPPTIEQLDRFLKDDSANAYERAVDRLLQSKHFGERMALMWMDAARYGDTSVYHADGPRDMWAWRDAVVQAYNDNLPFDQFSILQLAGDLVPDVPIERKILAGFNRNNGTTDEGGAFAEEYRVEYAVDRVKTTATVWMGLTMECAQCHDHKYDPISQEEYYKFFAFFNTSSDAGMQTRKGNAKPMIEIPDPAKQAKLPSVQQELDTARDKLQNHKTIAEPAFQKWLSEQEQQQSNETADLPTDLFAQYRIDEGKGKSIVDAVDKKRKGTFRGKIPWVTGRNSNDKTLSAIKLNGKTSVDLGDIADFERIDSFSFGGWVKPTKGSHGALLARMDNDNAHRGFDVLCGDRAIEVHLIHKWPQNAIKVKTQEGLKPGKWNHLFVTYDGSSKAAGVSVYVDGRKLDWKVEQDRLTETTRTKKSLLIGSRHGGSPIKAEVDQVTIFGRVLTATEVQRLAGASPISSILEIAADQRTAQQNATLREHFFEHEDKESVKLSERLQAITGKLTELKKPLTSVMVMGDTEKLRDTFILDRGAYDSPTDQKVEPGTLAVLPPMSDDLPKNRLGMAKWLFDDDHPLTARVAVNRYWQMLFGSGLVSTPEDFGAQGDYPTHPELLDWLAADFRESGWNIKRMLKQMVMSSTYQQSSAAPADRYVSDPSNRLLGRGPRFRLQGEMIRDNALFVSGLLVDQLGGPGVKPYQPAGLWKEVGLGGNPKFVQDHGDNLYRRSLYTYWKRSAPPPSMQIFDAPTREKCTVRRDRTNTPLQALVTLNDIQFVEASRHFAERILKSNSTTDQTRVATAFRIATARQPSDDEIKVLMSILDSAKSRYASDASSATTLLSIGESTRDEELDAVTHAAWTIVANAILNLDETLTRE